MIITNDLVESFLKCPTKCFLRSCGEAGLGNAYAAWVRTRNDVFRIEGTKRLVAGVAPDKCAIGPQAMENPKPAQWHLGMDFAVQSQNLQCSCHAVQQIPSAGRGRAAQFVPIRFVFRNKLNRDDKLLLAFDARVLSEVVSRGVGLGKIVHGENYATLKVKTSALASDVRKLTDKIDTLLASPSPPELVLNRHCTECEFQNRCRKKAIEKDDLSLLSGMPEKERTNFISRMTFWRTRTCHDPARAFSDGRVVSIGVKGRVGQRNAPTILNALYNKAQFWDGRANSLEEQADLPIVNPSEMG